MTFTFNFKTSSIILTLFTSLTTGSHSLNTLKKYTGKSQALRTRSSFCPPQLIVALLQNVTVWKIFICPCPFLYSTRSAQSLTQKGFFLCTPNQVPMFAFAPSYVIRITWAVKKLYFNGNWHKLQFLISGKSCSLKNESIRKLCCNWLRISLPRSRLGYIGITFFCMLMVFFLQSRCGTRVNGSFWGKKLHDFI